MDDFCKEMPEGQRLALERRGQRVAALRERIAEVVGGCKQITLEIGCGHGRWLAAYAEAHPKELCLGIDIISHRLKLCEKKKNKRGLSNLHFLKAEGRELMDALPEGLLLQKTFLLFPDPWPKKRHHKNRMVQDDFLRVLAGHTVAEGRFYFRTDHEDYFTWTFEKLKAHPSWKIENQALWPFEHTSWFQDLMDNYQSLVAKTIGS